MKKTIFFVFMLSMSVLNFGMDNSKSGSSNRSKTPQNQPIKHSTVAELDQIREARREEDRLNQLKQRDNSKSINNHIPIALFPA